MFFYFFNFLSIEQIIKYFRLRLNIHIFKCIICKEIFENFPDGGTNSVLLDQLFDTFVIEFIVKTAQGATKMFAEDVYERQKVPALVRHFTERMVSDQRRDFSSLIKAGFPR